jgi:DtxR family Mn-dependent transcriptional regulator
MTFTEENYLKAIYTLAHAQRTDAVSTNSLAEHLKTKASSVTDMIKKLSDKNWVEYEKYKGVSLSKEGERIALLTIRKHRLWEVFLVEKLSFTWDEVHEIAEELEHIQSTKLINNLDKFLGCPKQDPHGDPIPDEFGKIHHHSELMVNHFKIGEKGIIVGVKEHSASFLQFLDTQNINLGVQFTVEEIFPFDGSMILEIGNEKKVFSNLVVMNLYAKSI